jgi:hypothetical protein
MSKTARLVARGLVASLILSLGVTSCGEPPEPDESREQAATVVAEAKIIYDLVKKFYDFSKTLEKWTFGDRAAMELRAELDGIHFDIERIEGEVRRVSQHVDRAIVDAKMTALQGPRGQVATALDYLFMEGYQMSAELHAADAANTLSRSWHFYEMPTQWPDHPRFEPRVATTSFIEAVTAWLTIRAANGRPLDATLREKLAGYAAHLEEIARRTRGAVSCSTSCSIVWTQRPCVLTRRDPDEPPPECPQPKRSAWINVHCSDAISMQSEHLSNVAGQCWEEWSTPRPDLSNPRAEDRYVVQMFEETAALWRRIANQ